MEAASASKREGKIFNILATPKHDIHRRICVFFVFLLASGSECSQNWADDAQFERNGRLKASRHIINRLILLLLTVFPGSLSRHDWKILNVLCAAKLWPSFAPRVLHTHTHTRVYHYELYRSGLEGFLEHHTSRLIDPDATAAVLGQ